jgi:LuxR family quorum sensing-dependent transcriptional regulator
MPRTIAGLAQTASAILAAPDPKACSQIFKKAVATFQVDTFACGEVDLEVRERTVLYVIGWPESWRKFYMSSGLMQRDPLLDELPRRQTAFTWSELRLDRKLSVLGSEALQLIAQNGWTEGLAVPIPHGKHRCGLVSLACRRGPFSVEEKSLLTMLSLCFHNRLRNLASVHGFAMPPVGLSKREIECLKLIARGATDRSVAKELGVSLSTAHEFFEKAKKKLKVSTRAEAVAIAVALGIVSP